MAAGEVLDSLAAIVRELVENALDAGATRITVGVSIEQSWVRVTDNGQGMTLEDLQQAAVPHATSKIRDRQDLIRINSLGFRGEALHSLAQLADVEILSRATEVGWRARYTVQGEAVGLETAAIAPGTIVRAEQIFANWPTRRQGLPPVAQQLRAIQLTLQQIALCHPQVTWQVQNNDRDWFQLWGGKTAQQILPQILRNVRPEDLQVVHRHWEGGEWGLSGGAGSRAEVNLSEAVAAGLELLIGLPDRCHRYRPDWVKVAINGRCVQFPELEQVLLTAFRRIVPHDRYPIALLHLQAPADQIDWNRHPAKSEVYLHHLDTWKTEVVAAIQQALSLSPMNAATVYGQSASRLLKTAESQAGYAVGRTIKPDSTVDRPAVFLSPLKALAQVHQMYILAEHATGMWLVEQHIAHERVLYEQLCDRWQLVPLDPPLMLPQLTTAQIEQLQRLDITVEPFGEDLWAVRTAPDLLAQRSDCAAALEELSQGGDLSTAQVATACRSAIRNGTPLTLTEMQTLLDQWQQTQHPRTCPHGRPIYLALEESSLSRFFRRHWVIGKSHGI